MNLAFSHVETATQFGPSIGNISNVQRLLYLKAPHLPLELYMEQPFLVLMNGHLASFA